MSVNTCHRIIKEKIKKKQRNEMARMNESTYQRSLITDFEPPNFSWVSGGIRTWKTEHFIYIYIYIYIYI